MVNIELRTTFSKISELYDHSRISYPLRLVDDIIGFAILEEGNRVLDVGCGSGQATILFAHKGLNVIGLDLGKNLIEIARKKFSSIPNLEFKVGTFEDTKLTIDSFNLITSGMAWHWINPEVREQKAHSLLKENGVLALFWSYQPRIESTLVQEVGKILDDFGGVESGPAGSRVRKIAFELHEGFKNSKLFSQIEFKQYSEEIGISKERYFNLVLSYGWVQSLPVERKNLMIKNLQSLMAKYPRKLIIPYVHLLLLAKKS